MNQNIAQLENAQIIDVRLADDYAAAHIPKACNNCVFDVDFSKRLSEIAPDKSALTIIYGAGGESHEERMAFEKMERLGYEKLGIFEGGIAAYPQEKLTTGSAQPAVPLPLADGTRLIDLNESLIHWTGRNLTNKHQGELKLSSGLLSFKNGQVTGGDFTIDMASIKCHDLADTPGHAILIKHLLDHDFFDFEKHRDAKFTITHTNEIPEAKAGGENLKICGDLTLRGQTHPVMFTAACGIDPDGRAVAQATFSIDRTRWGVIYGSGKFFHRLAGHLVNDQIDLQLKIITNPQKK